VSENRRQLCPTRLTRFRNLCCSSSRAPRQSLKRLIELIAHGKRSRDAIQPTFGYAMNILWIPDDTLTSG
jgi:hypothetical protein